MADEGTNAVGPREQQLFDTASEWSFRGRRDKFAFPVPIIESGSGSVVVDTTGKEYLDFNSGQMCAAFGHSHPKIADAIAESARTLVHCGNTILNTKEIELAQELGQIVPRPLKKSTFLTSGSDANEAAMTVAKKATGGFEVAAPHLNMAGLGDMARQVTFVDGWHTGYGPGQPGVYAIITPYCYRCPLKLTYPSCELQCLKLSMELLDAQSCGELAAVLTEPIFSAGGVIEPPPGWLGALKDACHERGMLLIFDEAQTGMGKTGDMFACEHEGVIPDIMTLSKHFGGGVEVSAMISTPEVEEKAFEAGLVMGHSHTNDPLGCNAGIASVRLVVEEGLVAKAKAMGKYWRAHLENMAQRYEIIGDIRGRGLLQGLEFVRDRHSKEAYSGFAKDVGDRCNQKGLFLSVRRKASMLRFVPPFTTTNEQFDLAAEIIDSSIAESLEARAQNKHSS
jgi:2,2-dialkylglycine decarboxylase (pyruvate)